MVSGILRLYPSILDTVVYVVHWTPVSCRVLDSVVVLFCSGPDSKVLSFVHVSSVCCVNHVFFLREKS